MLRTTLLLAVLLTACYGKPELPDVPLRPGAPPPVDASLPRDTPQPRPLPQAQRAQQIAGVLARLSEPTERPAPERDGAVSWRAAELEKLHELMIACCQNEAGPCRACTEQIGAAQLPADEVWPLAGRFLGPLQPRAVAGLPPLLMRFLNSESAPARDRAYRLLVGARVMRRGQIDESGHSAATLPARPAIGEPVWVVVERIAPCGEGRASFKGPDPTGQLDVLIEPECAEVEVEEGVLVPRVHRIVGALHLPAFPASGLRVHAPGGLAPVLTVRSQGPAEKPAP